MASPENRQEYPSAQEKKTETKSLAQACNKSHVFQEWDSLQSCLEKVGIGDLYAKNPDVRTDFERFLLEKDIAFQNGDEFQLTIAPGNPAPEYKLQVHRDGQELCSFNLTDVIQKKKAEWQEIAANECRSNLKDLRQHMSGHEKQEWTITPDRIFHEAEKYLWTPYGKKGMDCSHFVSAVCRDCWAVSQDFYKTSAELHKMADPVSRENVQPWDLFFFMGRNGCSHVGFVGPGWLGDGRLDVIHASSSAWVCHKTEGLGSLSGGHWIAFGRLPIYNA